MTTGIVLLNFGEPENPTLEQVVPFLEKIFMINASLENIDEYERAKKRSRQLAVERAPGLIEEYELIGGSPLHAQARAQAVDLARELSQRGHAVKTYIGMQFTEPGIPDAVASARADGVTRLIGLPVYPLCGPSTTIAALTDLRKAIDASGWDVEVREITGWHPHPLYTALRADAIRKTATDNRVDLNDPRTKLVYSAHGTPRKYLDEGSRYEQYVEESCKLIADALGVSNYVIGYQNHTNRPGVKWTEPDIEKVIETVDADTVIVDGVAFMHEQSETLAELDHDLREEAEERGLTYYRVPTPWNDPRLQIVLADLCEPLIAKNEPEGGLKPCRCREQPGTFCLNRR
jgi:protoporphyrin/coproporphyrin ferrochelatase